MKATMSRTRALAALLAFALLPFAAGCASYPAPVRDASPEVSAASYPALVPTDAIRAAAAEPPRAAPAQDTAQPELARAARLKARAASLRGDVIDAEDRERLGKDITIDEEDV